jgi:hypothetical protein
LGLISAFLNDPLLFTFIEISLVVTVVLTDHALDRIIVSISDIVGSLGYFPWTFNVVGEKGQSVGSACALADLCVELSIFVSAVLPLFLLLGGLLLAVEILEVVVEEILAIDQFSSIPLGNVTPLKKIKDKVFDLHHWGR